MKLYHFTVAVDNEEIPVIVAADSDEQAFKRAEIEVEKSFLKFPKIKEVVLLERKKITSSGTAFVVL